MEDFFTVFKRKRRERYTQAEFAKHLGISDTQLQNYEKDVLPPHDKLLKINELLGYDFSRHIYQFKVGESVGQDQYNALLEDLEDIIRKHRPNSDDLGQRTESDDASQALRDKYPEDRPL